FLAGAFLAGAFLAGALVAAVFLAGALATGALVVSFGACDGFITASLNAFSGVIRAFFDALIWMVSPVAGLRPMCACRSTLANLAKPEMATCSPLATVPVITSVTPRSMLSTSLAS